MKQEIMITDRMNKFLTEYAEDRNMDVQKLANLILSEWILKQEFLRNALGKKNEVAI